VSTSWQDTWEAHSDIFVVRNWQECPAEKRKTWRLPAKFSYFMGGETTLRAGMVVSPTQPREEEFLLAGVLWGNRLSNGAKTVLYFVAPDFSPFFLQVLGKIGGNLTAKAVYWREKLKPSLYLIPERNYIPANPGSYPALGEERPDWRRWGQGLNPVARQQLEIVRQFFAGLTGRRVRAELKPQQILFLWGDFEIAEVVRKGKKFELISRTKWEKNPERAQSWQKAGWVDISGRLNQDFCLAIEDILRYLEGQEASNSLPRGSLLRLWLGEGGGVVASLWGNPWQWPWLPKERGDFASELSQWFCFQANGQLSVVCPILEKPLAVASSSILLAEVLEHSSLLRTAVNEQGEKLVWDGRVHWLTVPDLVEELRRWYCWLKRPEQFPIWTLAQDWQTQGIHELHSRNVST